MPQKSEFIAASKHSGGYLGKAFRLKKGRSEEFIEEFTAAGFEPNHEYTAQHIRLVTKNNNNNEWGLDLWQPPKAEDSFEEGSIIMMFQNTQRTVIWVTESELEVKANPPPIIFP